MSKMTNKLLSIGVLATGLMLTASVAHAQSYTVTTDTQAFTSIVGNGDTVIGTGDDVAFLTDTNATTLTLPFDFVYFGLNRAAGTPFSVCTNGFISFDVATNSASRVASAIPSTAAPNDALFLFHDDFRSTFQGDIRFLVQGTAGSRTLTIEFNDNPLFSPTNTSLVGQIVLFEGSNVIRFNYDQTAVGLLGNGFGSVGIENADGTAGIEGVVGSPNLTDLPTTNIIFTPVVIAMAELAPAGAPAPSNNNPAINDNIGIDRTITNLGSTDANNFVVTYYLSTDSTIDTNDTVVATETISIAANSSDVGTSPSFQVTQGGAFFVGYIVDTGMTITEADENNNTSAGASLFVGQMPDITGTISSTNGVVTVQQGAPLTFTLNLTNTASNPTGPFTVDIFLSDNNIITGNPTFDVFLVNVPIPNGIAAQGTFSMDITANVAIGTLPDVYFLGFIADPNDVVPESDETNNDIPSATADVTVVPPPQIDFQPTVVTPQVTTIVAGNPLSVDRTIANNGADASGQFDSQVVLSLDNILDANDTVLTTETIAMIAGNGTDVGTTIAMIPANTAPGMYFIIYNADSGMAVSETDETNNDLASVQITVNAAGAGPDLTVPTASLSTQSAAANSSIMVTRTISNIGSQASGSFRSGIYLSTDNVITVSDIQLTTFTITDIAASGSNGPESIVVTIPNVPPGTYFIGVIADDDSMIPEVLDTNNTSTALSIVVNNRVGDLNGDTIVDIMDIQACINQSIGLLAPSAAGDVNGDGSVNVLDVQLTINVSLQPTP